MRLLLDAHVILWWLLDDPRLSREVAAHLDDEPDVYVSTAWEIAIQHSASKLDGPPDLPERIVTSGFTVLPIGMNHALAAGRLPMIHCDPFDRMLIAQARCEGLTLVTADDQVRRCDVPAFPP